MRRRNSFCSSELPSATQALDHFFNIERLHSSPDPAESKTSWSSNRSCAHSVGTMTTGLDPEVGGAAEEAGLPQVDGPAARRKAKKMEKAKQKKKGKEEKKDGCVMGVYDEEEAQIEQVEHVEGERSRDEKSDKANTNGQDAGCPTNVSGVFVVYGDGGVSKLEPYPEQQQLGQNEEQYELRHPYNREPEYEDENQQEHKQEHQEIHENKLICRVHRRMLCQFNDACCVHRPPVECGCPPRASCCCIHHAGDCCYCRTDDIAGAVTQDENESKTLSVAESATESVAGPDTPTTPPISTPPPVDEASENANAAPTAVSAKSSITSPENTSGIRVMVIPASPSPFRPVSPIKMLAAETENTSAAQASLELSNNLIHMMECNHMSDIKLILRSINNQFWPIVLTAHKCVLSRSPLITSILLGKEYYSEEITVVAGENFSMIKPWEQVVHHLYGKPIIKLETLKPITLEGLGYDPLPAAGCEPEYPFSLHSAMLDMAIGYAVCGAFFYLTPVVDAGFGLAIDLLSWETVEHVLYCGLYTYKFMVVMPKPPWVEEAERQYEESGRHTQDVGAQGEVVKASGADADGDSKPNTENAHPDPAPARNPTADAIAVTSTEGLYPTQYLESDWSRRLVGASLDFVVENMRPDFKLYSAAQSRILPDRIPDFLKSPPEPPTSIAPSSVKEKKSRVRNTLTQTQSHPPSAAVANNPRLADVKFGSFPSLGLEPIAEEVIDENHEDAVGGQKSNERHNSTERQTKESFSNRSTPDIHTPSSNQAGTAASEDKDAVDAAAKLSPQSTTAIPGPEVIIPSAILLTLGFYELHLAFSMLAKRDILTSALAQEIIIEREARRQAALRNYAAVLIAKAQKESESSANPATAGGGVVEGAKMGKGRLKGKARKAQREQKKNDAVDDVEKDTDDVESVSVSAVHVPHEVKELCYREFYSSKTTHDPRQGGEDEVGVEIVLEREWVGFQY